MRSALFNIRINTSKFTINLYHFVRLQSLKHCGYKNTVLANFDGNTVDFRNNDCYNMARL